MYIYTMHNITNNMSYSNRYLHVCASMCVCVCFAFCLLMICFFFFYSDEGCGGEVAHYSFSDLILAAKCSDHIFLVQIYSFDKYFCDSNAHMHHCLYNKFITPIAQTQIQFVSYNVHQFTNVRSTTKQNINLTNHHNELFLK